MAYILNHIYTVTRLELNNFVNIHRWELKLTELVKECWENWLASLKLTFFILFRIGSKNVKTPFLSQKHKNIQNIQLILFMNNLNVCSDPIPPKKLRCYPQHWSCGEGKSRSVNDLHLWCRIPFTRAFSWWIWLHKILGWIKRSILRIIYTHLRSGSAVPDPDPLPGFAPEFLVRYEQYLHKACSRLFWRYSANFIKID